MVYILEQDIIASVVAFIALASLIVAYVDYRPKMADYLAFAAIFAIFGFVACLYFSEANWTYLIAGTLCYGIGTMVVLFAKSTFIKSKQE